MTTLGIIYFYFFKSVELQITSRTYVREVICNSTLNSNMYYVTLKQLKKAVNVNHIKGVHIALGIKQNLNNYLMYKNMLKKHVIPVTTNSMPNSRIKPLLTTFMHAIQLKKGILQQKKTIKKQKKLGYGRKPKTPVFSNSSVSKKNNTTRKVLDKKYKSDSKKKLQIKTVQERSTEQILKKNNEKKRFINRFLILKHQKKIPVKSLKLFTIFIKQQKKYKKDKIKKYKKTVLLSKYKRSLRKSIRIRKVRQKVTSKKNILPVLKKKHNKNGEVDTNNKLNVFPFLKNIKKNTILRNMSFRLLKKITIKKKFKRIYNNNYKKNVVQNNKQTERILEYKALQESTLFYANALQKVHFPVDHKDFFKNDTLWSVHQLQMHLKEKINIKYYNSTQLQTSLLKICNIFILPQKKYNVTAAEKYGTFFKKKRLLLVTKAHLCSIFQKLKYKTLQLRLKKENIKKNIYLNITFKARNIFLNISNNKLKIRKSITLGRLGFNKAKKKAFYCVTELSYLIRFFVFHAIRHKRRIYLYTVGGRKKTKILLRRILNKWFFKYFYYVMHSHRKAHNGTKKRKKPRK